MGLKLPLFCLGAVLAVFIWSAINPYERGTWWMEVIPVIIALPILIATYRKFRLTDMLYVLIALHCLVLLVGGHYTYARVPLFDDIKEMFGLTRNHYDRVGHVMQGFVPAMIGRELVIRTTPLKGGKWLAALLILSAFGIGAIYEIIEWIAAVITKDGAESFLATQGDIWDTQKDMALAGFGAALALVTLSKFHNRALERLLRFIN
jgi:putative membrane protein